MDLWKLLILAYLLPNNLMRELMGGGGLPTEAEEEATVAGRIQPGRMEIAAVVGVSREWETGPAWCFREVGRAGVVIGRPWGSRER